MFFESIRNFMFFYVGLLTFPFAIAGVQWLWGLPGRVVDALATDRSSAHVPVHAATPSAARLKVATEAVNG